MQALRPRPRRARGFTLLEVIAAILLFLIMVSYAILTTSGAGEMAVAGQNARTLRMLAELKLGQVAVFERHFDAEVDEEFEDLPEEMGDAYREWRYSTTIRDVTVFGVQKDENAPYLFGDADEKAEEGTDSGTAGASATAKKGDTQVLREIVLKVAAPGSEGDDEGDSIEIVTFLPQVPQKTAKAATK